MTNMPKIGKYGHMMRYNIARTRITNGITYVELAKRASEAGHPMRWQLLGRIERGDAHVDIDDLFAIAQGLGVTPTYLITPDTSCPACHGAPPGDLPCPTCCTPPAP